MLVLSRRENERIKLGNSIVVTVVRVSRDKVRLGIEAPADMLVLREELDSAVEPAMVEGVDAVLAPTQASGDAPHSPAKELLEACTMPATGQRRCG